MCSTLRRLRVNLTPMIQSQLLLTFQDILDDDKRVTQLEELTPGEPIHIGSCDAAKDNMGSVWFPKEGHLLLW